MAKMRTERDRKARSVNKKKKDIEEITLGSSSEEEDSDSDEVKSLDQDEPMDIDEHPAFNGENGNDSSEEQKVGENGNDSSEEQKVEEDKTAEGNVLVSNGSDELMDQQAEEKAPATEPESNAKAGEVLNDSHVNEESKEPSKLEENITDKIESKNDEIIQQRLHPELKPGHVWTREESKEIFKHLIPRIALVKLKHGKKYLKEMNKKHYDEDEQEVSQLRNLLKTNMVMQLANGVSAVVKANGDTTVLPADYKERIQVMEKRITRWKEESSWIPPKMGVAKKLNLAGIKLGRSIKQPKIVLHKIDPM